jgi:hypothetical protein
MARDGWDERLCGKRVEITYQAGQNEVMYGLVEDVTDKFVVFRPDLQPKRLLFLNPARIVVIKLGDGKKVEPGLIPAILARLDGGDRTGPVNATRTPPLGRNGRRGASASVSRGRR